MRSSEKTGEELFQRFLEVGIAAKVARKVTVVAMVVAASKRSDD